MVINSDHTNGGSLPLESLGVKTSPNNKIQQLAQTINTSNDEFMEWEERDETKISFLKHCIAGSCAGIMEHISLYPVDTLKTHLQASGTKNLGFSQIARILYKEEGGFMRFWKGANVVASGCIPAHAFQFAIYEYLMSKADFQRENEINVLTTMGIGAASTFGHDVFQTPADVIKQRMQLCGNMSGRKVLQQVIQEEGVTGLFRSFPVTLLMNVPFMSIVVCLNENLKTYLQPQERRNPMLWYFGCAGIAGGVAGVLTNPLDVVKTRMQTQEIQPSCQRLRDIWKGAQIQQQNIETMGKKQSEFASEKIKGPGECRKNIGKTHNISIKQQSCDFEVNKLRYRNLLQSIIYIKQSEGMGAFSRGIFSRMAINVPSTAISWGTYELMKSFLQKKE